MRKKFIQDTLFLEYNKKRLEDKASFVVKNLFINYAVKHLRADHCRLSHPAGSNPTHSKYDDYKSYRT
jgi:hypothetical protein